jgi:hypothetical protein
MGIIIPEGYGQLAIAFNCTGKTTDFVSTIGVDLQVSTDLPAVLDSIRALWTAGGRPLNQGNVLVDYRVSGWTLTKMTGTGPISATLGAEAQGTLTGTPPPPNCSYMVRKITARGGRQGRGRMFFPPLWTSETNVDAAGVLTSVSRNAIQVYIDALMGAWEATTFPPVLLHSDADPPDPITSLSLQQTLATQRRRLRS